MDWGIGVRLLLLPLGIGRGIDGADESWAYEAAAAAEAALCFGFGRFTLSAVALLAFGTGIRDS